MIRGKRGRAVRVATNGVGGNLVGAFWADTGVWGDPVHNRSFFQFWSDNTQNLDVQKIFEQDWNSFASRVGMLVIEYFHAASGTLYYQRNWSKIEKMKKTEEKVKATKNLTMKICCDTNIQIKTYNKSKWLIWTIIIYNTEHSNWYNIKSSQIRGKNFSWFHKVDNGNSI